MADDTDWARNDMTEAQWNALPETDKTWRRAHPKHPAPVTGGPAAPVAARAPAKVVDEPKRDDRGGQVVLTGEARAAARGAYGSIERNTFARDAAIEAGDTTHSSAPDDRKPPQYAIDAAVGMDPVPEMSVADAQRALDAAKAREKQANELNQPMARARA